MKKIKPIYEYTLVMIIIVTGAFLRFYRIGLSPDWYSDEGAFIEVAKNLMYGKWQYFAIQGSPLLVGRPPLFFYILAAVFKLFGVHIIVLRGLTAVYGLITIVLLYVIVRKWFGAGTALLSAGILAIYPWAVAFNRVGFTYNQLPPLLLLNVLANWQFSKNRNIYWGALACLTAGLGVMTDYMGIAAVGLTLAVFLVTDWRKIFPGFLFIILLITLVMLPIFIVDFPGALQDLNYTFFRISIPLPSQFVNMIIFYGHLVFRDTWILLGLIGICLLPERRAKWITFALCSFVIFLLVRLSSPPRHQLIPLLPFACLGMASFLRVSISKANRKICSDAVRFLPSLPIIAKNSSISKAFPLVVQGASVSFAALFIVSPLFWMFSMSVVEVQTSGVLFKSDEILREGFVPELEVNNVIQKLSRMISQDDVVIASPFVAWALPGKVIDIQQSVDYVGGESYALPELSPDRFAFDSSLPRVTYVVEDDLWHVWGVRVMPDIQLILNQVDQWPVLFSIGEFQVRRNPAIDLKTLNNGLVR